jgi:hypothetical protein
MRRVVVGLKIFVLKSGIETENWDKNADSRF